MNKTQEKAKAKLEEYLDQKVESKDNTLYNILEDYAPTDKEYEYGFVPEHDFVCISKDGTVGQFVEIQNLVIGIPKAPEVVYARSEEKTEQYWEPFEMPEILKKIPTALHFDKHVTGTLRDELFELSDQEWDRREQGFWFMNNGEPTWVTGSHYMYLQHSYIDVGLPDYREANRMFFYFWEACKADERSLGMCYLKNRRSGFSFMSSAETVNLATQTKNARYGMLSKTGPDAKGMFTNKVVPISFKYPFFFKPIQAGMDKPKSEIVYDVPATKLTKTKLKQFDIEDEFAGLGLGTSIDWKSTADNSYDGEKLQLLVHDESGKWEKPNNILKNWNVTRTCLITGANIVGKCMMGSTSNALDSGGEEFKSIYEDSDVTKRDGNGWTASGLYAFFVPMEWGFEGFIDRYGLPVFRDPETPVTGIDGRPIKQGVLDYWENRVEALKHNSDNLNEFYRQFPRTEAHAFRDVAENALFNVERIYEQIDMNVDLERDGILFKGDFRWENGVPFSKVQFYPSNHGKFHLTWVPPRDLQNNVIDGREGLLPGNEHMGAFGLDSYDISGTVDGGGSNGAMHGITTFNVDQAPSNQFFLEYIARPKTVELFYEAVLMACIFYGMPILIENNKPGVLHYFKRHGYRKFCMNRPDKRLNELSVSEKEIGGIPNNSEFIKQAHAAAIGSYIEEHVGWANGEAGQMYFNRTLQDWLHFDITKRTKHDASISSGLALMAIQKYKYTSRPPKQIIRLDLGGVFKRT